MNQLIGVQLLNLIKNPTEIPRLRLFLNVQAVFERDHIMLLSTAAIPPCDSAVAFGDLLENPTIGLPDLQRLPELALGR